MSTKRKFTPEEIKNLKANPYTLRVTEVTSGIWPSFLLMNIITTPFFFHEEYAEVNVPKQ